MVLRVSHVEPNTRHERVRIVSKYKAACVDCWKQHILSRVETNRDAQCLQIDCHNQVSENFLLSLGFQKDEIKRLQNHCAEKIIVMKNATAQFACRQKNCSSPVYSPPRSVEYGPEGGLKLSLLIFFTSAFCTLVVVYMPKLLRGNYAGYYDFARGYSMLYTTSLCGFFLGLLWPSKIAEKLWQRLRVVNIVVLPKKEHSISVVCARGHNAKWPLPPANEKDSENFANVLKTTKGCPTCGVRIEKNGGCPRMHCSVCQAWFCWDCQQKKLPSDGTCACLQ